MNLPLLSNSIFYNNSDEGIYILQFLKWKEKHQDFVLDLNDELVHTNDEKKVKYVFKGLRKDSEYPVFLMEIKKGKKVESIWLTYFYLTWALETGRLIKI